MHYNDAFRADIDDVENKGIRLIYAFFLFACLHHYGA